MKKSRKPKTVLFLPDLEKYLEVLIIHVYILHFAVRFCKIDNDEITYSLAFSL